MVNHCLLSLSGRIYFLGLILPWICDQDLSPTMGVVSSCSHTLESLHASLWVMPNVRVRICFYVIYGGSRYQ